MDRGGHTGRTSWRHAPRRAAEAVGRLLRMPGQQSVRHDEVRDQLRVTQIRLVEVAIQLAEIQRGLAHLRAASDRSGELTSAVRDESQANTAALDDLRRAVAALAAASGQASVETKQHVLTLTAEHREAVRRIAATTAALADHVAATDALAVPDGPLVSVVLPVRDRADVLARAVSSVRAQTYAHWECIVVDDGSEQDIEKVVATPPDDRIRVVHITASGAGAARNAGMREATGELVTFLDSDNEWFPARLARVVGAMDVAPWANWAVDGQLIDDTGRGLPYVRDTRRPLTDLDDGNFIDLGALVVRRPLLDAVGGFDPELTCLGDWDLIRRLALAEPPARLSTIGYRYHDDRDDRLSTTAPYGPAAHRIRRQAIGTPADGVRVLFAEWHYPQVTETYMEADLQGLRQLGARVEVWSQEDVAVPHPTTVPVHRGELHEAIGAVRPDIVVSHWLSTGLAQREATRAAGIPHAVRAHGFDFDPAAVDELLRDPGVVVHLHPHHFDRWALHPQAVSHTVAFDPTRYQPRPDKDRSLVVRIMAGLLTKDIEVFFEAAKRCLHHRFVLAIGHAYQVEERTEQVIELAEAAGAPVDIRTDLDFAAAAELVSSAGIYLHTHGTAHPMGMPVSIAEALATGAYTLVRDLPGACAYLGGAGALYRGSTVEERADDVAALINATTHWAEDRWQEAWTSAVDVAWTRFPSDLVAAQLFATWQERLGVGPP